MQKMQSFTADSLHVNHVVAVWLQSIRSQTSSRMAAGCRLTHSFETAQEAQGRLTSCSHCRVIATLKHALNTDAGIIGLHLSLQPLNAGQESLPLPFHVALNRPQFPHGSLQLAVAPR